MSIFQDFASILFPPYGVYHAYDVVEEKVGTAPLQTLNLGLLAVIVIGAYMLFKK